MFLLTLFFQHVPFENKKIVVLKTLMKSAKHIKSFQKNELEYTLLNFILKHKKIRSFLKWCYIAKGKVKFQSRVIAKSKCVFSGRSRGVYRFAFLSRLFLRENSFINKLPGLRKSYW